MNTVLSATGTICISILGLFVWIVKSINNLSKDIAVIRQYLADGLEVKKIVKSNTENLIRVDERQKKLTVDVNTAHQRIREITHEVSKHKRN